MEGKTIVLRVPKDHWHAWKDEAHRRRISGNKLLLDLLHAALVAEGHRLCVYCEPGNRHCPGHGRCHCGCGTATAAKFFADHHSRRIPLATAPTRVGE